MVNESKCWVCLRITPATVLKLAHKVWNENWRLAREMGLEASKIIEQSYQRNPIFFCGKSAKSVLSGLFYILCIRHNIRKTQQEIAEALGIAELTLRRNYQGWIRNFPELKEPEDLNEIHKHLERIFPVHIRKSSEKEEAVYIWKKGRGWSEKIRIRV